MQVCGLCQPSTVQETLQIPVFMQNAAEGKFWDHTMGGGRGGWERAVNGDHI